MTDDRDDDGNGSGTGDEANDWQTPNDWQTSESDDTEEDDDSLDISSGDSSFDISSDDDSPDISSDALTADDDPFDTSSDDDAFDISSEESSLDVSPDDDAFDISSEQSSLDVSPDDGSPDASADGPSPDEASFDVSSEGASTDGGSWEPPSKGESPGEPGGSANRASDGESAEDDDSSFVVSGEMSTGIPQADLPDTNPTLFPSKPLAVGTFLGGPLAGTGMIAYNFYQIERHQWVFYTLAAGLIATTITYGLVWNNACLIAHTAFGNAFLAFLVGTMTEQFFDKNDFEYQSHSMAVGVGVGVGMMLVSGCLTCAGAAEFSDDSSIDVGAVDDGPAPHQLDLRNRA